MKFILPSVILISITTPISVILGRKLKSFMLPNRNHILEQNRKWLRTRMRQDFLFRDYRGIYFKTYAPKKFGL
ncbi:MAG: hypothetical protein ACW986_12525 [Promethearchaeota archaeon]